MPQKRKRSIPFKIGIALVIGSNQLNIQTLYEFKKHSIYLQ